MVAVLAQMYRKHYHSEDQSSICSVQVFARVVLTSCFKSGVIVVFLSSFPPV